METKELRNFLFHLEKEINKFEIEKKNQKKLNKNHGTVYTPQKIADFMVRKIFRAYFRIPNLRYNLNNIVPHLKILDPACGSGRFLIAIAKSLYLIYKNIDLNLDNYHIKKRIIEKNLFGIDIDSSALKISKLRLIKWLISDLPNFDETSLKINKIDQISKKIDLNFHLYAKDFLLEFELNKFDIIIGNPPYIENKKIFNKEYKKNLKKRFKSAYRLFDLSILFIEKSLELLKQNKGLLSFIVNNKFLSADYGIKLREFLINKVEIKEIIDLSSISIFHSIAAYPIIISIRKKTPNNSLLLLKQLDFSKNISTNLLDKIQQNSIKLLPGSVIPISKNINLVKGLYEKYKPLSETITDLNIIYRPYGFLNWSKNFKYVSQSSSSNKDLLLIGTGNVENFCINLKKPIKIAKQKKIVSYFNYNSLFRSIWKELGEEKLIFREIAKDLTFVYDPGIFTNITGLYFIRIPSYTTNELISLLLILNSDLMNLTFKTLFGTLHMAGNYLRINGSFIKRLPLPEIIPVSISRLGKLLQFLFQFKSDFTQLNIFAPPFDIELNFFEKLVSFYTNLSNALINGIYLSEVNSIDYENLFNALNYLPEFQLKYFHAWYDIPKYKVYRNNEIETIYNSILDNYIILSGNNKFLELIKQFLKLHLNSKIP